MPDIKSHERVNDILLGPLERPALRWLAAHMPAWMNPDILTTIGIFGSMVVFTGYCLTNLSSAFLWLASLGMVINWFGDSLDGTLARHRHVERPKYGFFVDHTTDAISEVLVFLGLGLSPYIRFEIACLALISYLLMCILVYVRTSVSGVFRISYAKIGPTEMRLIVIIANAIIFFIGNPAITLPFGSLTMYDMIGIVVAVVLTSAFVVSTLIDAVKLAKAGE